MKGTLRRMVGRPKKHSPERPCAKVLESKGDVQLISQCDDISSTDIERYLNSQEKLRKESEGEIPLTGEALIEALFAGAPQFSVKIVDGRSTPSISFPWDYSLEVRDASDCLPMQHPAFSASTTYGHLVPQYRPVKHAPEFGIGIREVPNMLYATGREPGTVGFIHFLEEPLSDAFGSPSDASEADAARNRLRTSSEDFGIRKYDASVMAEHLRELGTVYQNYCHSDGTNHILKDSSACRIYGKLFTQLLSCSKESSNDDPTGLKLQISVLIDLLNEPHIWFDFSSAEWRVRLGALLWPPETHESTKDAHTDQEALTDRQIVILQLTLACELLLRLDAVAAVTVDELYDELNMTPENIADFEIRETKKSKWDLWLARYFLRNTEAKLEQKLVSTKTSSAAAPKPSIFALLTPQPDSTSQTRAVTDVVFVPRDTELQLAGLAKFAKIIGWEDAKAVDSQIRSSLKSMDKDSAFPATPLAAANPLATPSTAQASRQDYFQDDAEEKSMSAPKAFDLQELSPARGKPPPADGSLDTLGGWLTRAYLTGVVLPGEAVSHYLISTLIENDLKASDALGKSISLYGGFTYNGQSWWSKACIVGRVLSALPNSRESMGWIHTTVAPESLADSWIDVCCEPVLQKGDARILSRKAIDEDAVFAPSGESASVTSKSFTLPQDCASNCTFNVTFKGLHFEPSKLANATSKRRTSAESLETSNSRLQPQSAKLQFTSSPSDTSTSIPLRHLVSFISAFPCFPRPDVSHLLQHDPLVAAHALHTSYKYRTIHATQLLQEDYTSASPAQSCHTHTPAGEVLVIDARGDATLALLARAWCAHAGEHAVVGRVGSSCLACCVMEARALAVRVVVRVG